MRNQRLQNIATRLIREEFAAREIAVKQILLFGSRARGDASSDSDWDFLVVTGKRLSWSEKLDVWLTLARRLAIYAMTADILIKFEQDFERDRYDVGKTTYYAAKEGAFV
jgi:predicted nucleotidyltransferase